MLTNLKKTDMRKYLTHDSTFSEYKYGTICIPSLRTTFPFLFKGQRSSSSTRSPTIVLAFYCLSVFDLLVSIIFFFKTNTDIFSLSKKFIHYFIQLFRNLHKITAQIQRFHTDLISTHPIGLIWK